MTEETAALATVRAHWPLPVVEGSTATLLQTMQHAARATVKNQVALWQCWLDADLHRHTVAALSALSKHAYAQLSRCSNDPDMLELWTDVIGACDDIISVGHWWQRLHAMAECSESVRVLLPDQGSLATNATTVKDLYAACQRFLTPVDQVPPPCSLVKVVRSSKGLLLETVPTEATLTIYPQAVHLKLTPASNAPHSSVLICGHSRPKTRQLCMPLGKCRVMAYPASSRVLEVRIADDIWLVDCPSDVARDRLVNSWLALTADDEMGVPARGAPTFRQLKYMQLPTDIPVIAHLYDNGAHGFGNNATLTAHLCKLPGAVKGKEEERLTLLVHTEETGKLLVQMLASNVLNLDVYLPPDKTNQSSTHSSVNAIVSPISIDDGKSADRLGQHQRASQEPRMVLGGYNDAAIIGNAAVGATTLQVWTFRMSSVHDLHGLQRFWAVWHNRLKIPPGVPVQRKRLVWDTMVEIVGDDASTRYRKLGCAKFFLIDGTVAMEALGPEGVRDADRFLVMHAKRDADEGGSIVATLLDAMGTISHGKIRFGSLDDFGDIMSKYVLCMLFPWRHSSLQSVSTVSMEEVAAESLCSQTSLMWLHRQRLSNSQLVN